VRGKFGMRVGAEFTVVVGGASSWCLDEVFARCCWWHWLVLVAFVNGGGCG
jgi:hypothetical protein